MFSIGSTIKDSHNFSWRVIHIWEYKQYLCFGLLGASKENFGAMGGTRFEIESKKTVNS